jgi:hypothetical protein
MLQISVEHGATAQKYLKTYEFALTSPTVANCQLESLQARSRYELTMSTHSAVATVAKKASLSSIQVPTAMLAGQQVCVRVEWIASMPQDLRQNDGA